MYLFGLKCVFSFGRKILQFKLCFPLLNHKKLQQHVWKIPSEIQTIAIAILQLYAEKSMNYSVWLTPVLEKNPIKITGLTTVNNVIWTKIMIFTVYLIFNYFSRLLRQFSLQLRWNLLWCTKNICGGFYFVIHVYHRKFDENLRCS